MYAVKIKVDNDSWPIKRIEDRYYRAISVDHCLKPKFYVIFFSVKTKLNDIWIES